jgi:hypothetical protein
MKLASYSIRKGGSQRVHWVGMNEDLLLVREAYPLNGQLLPLLSPDAWSW